MILYEKGFPYISKIMYEIFLKNRKTCTMVNIIESPTEQNNY